MNTDNLYPEKLRTVLEQFDQLSDIDQRAELLVSYAEAFRAVPPSVATRPYREEHRIPSCESEAFVWALPNPDGTLRFHFAVENPSGVSAKALAVILEKTLSGAPLTQVAAVNSEIVSRLFRANMSMGKGIGLTNIVEMVRFLARRELIVRASRG